MSITTLRCPAFTEANGGCGEPVTHVVADIACNEATLYCEVHATAHPTCASVVTALHTSVGY